RLDMTRSMRKMIPKKYRLTARVQFYADRDGKEAVIFSPSACHVDLMAFPTPSHRAFFSPVLLVPAYAVRRARQLVMNAHILPHAPLLSAWSFHLGAA